VCQRVGDPVHHGKGELLLAGEEMIDRPSGVSGFGCDLFECEIAIVNLIVKEAPDETPE
jgi:hypothetical protein